MSATAIIRMPGEGKEVRLAGKPMTFFVTGQDTKHTSMFDWTWCSRFSASSRLRDLNILAMKIAIARRTKDIVAHDAPILSQSANPGPDEIFGNDSIAAGCREARITEQGSKTNA